MNKNKKNISSAPAENQYTLTPEDIKKIEDDAKELIEFIDEYINLDTQEDDAYLNWSVCSDDYMTLCRYQEYLRPKFLETFGGSFSLEQNMWCEYEKASLSVVFERFPISFDEITKVSKYIFETAKSMGCYYTGVDIDVFEEDDPRHSY